MCDSRRRQVGTLFPSSPGVPLPAPCSGLADCTQKNDPTPAKCGVVCVPGELPNPYVQESALYCRTVRTASRGAPPRGHPTYLLGLLGARGYLLGEG
jgi:hypothetical protein